MGDWISAIGSALSGGLNALGTWLGADTSARAQRDINEQNMQLQREAWSREDNAIQRRVADLKAAGLSPTLAAGQGAAASGPAISLKSTDNGWGALGGIGKGIENAIRNSREQDILKSQAKQERNKAKLSDEQANYYSYLASYEKDKLGYQAQLAKFNADITTYLEEELKWQKDHRTSREVLSWIKGIGGLMPSLRFTFQ